MIGKVMAECNRLKASSVAFPALGTGALGFPQDVAAKIMVQAAHQYLQGNSNTSVKKVIFVIYQDEVLNAFQRELTTLTPAVPSGPTRAQPLPPMQPMQSSLSQHTVSPKWAPEISSHHNQILVKKGPLTDSQVCCNLFSTLHMKQISIHYASRLFYLPLAIQNSALIYLNKYFTLNM